jgi:hypothetical protein
MKGGAMQWIVCLVLACASASAAPLSEICLSCGQQIQKTIYTYKSPYYKDRQSFCATCAVLKTTCFTCKLPFAKFVDLKDGRILCPKDSKTAILSGDEAQSIFHDVKRDVMKLLGGSRNFPDRNITFNLVDYDELQNLSRKRRFPQTHNTLYGLTRSSAVDAKEFEHKIDVLSGLTRGQFIGACAHEYGHAWMEQNTIKDRLIDADAIEGFCELLAWKITGDRGEQLERQFIRENDYTRGQIDAFIQADQDYTFYRVMKWVMAGADPKFTHTNTARVLALTQDPVDNAAAFAWPPPSPVAPPAPDTLVLKSISGSAKRRFALINGTTLGVNETAKVRLGTSNVVVKCLDIRDSSVVVQLASEAKPTELLLPKPDSAR